MLLSSQFNKTMPISSFILATVVLCIVLYYSIGVLLKIKQIYKFKKQDVIFYENKKIVKTLFLFPIITGLLFLLLVISFILFLNNKDNTTYIIVNECLAMIFLIFAVIYVLFIIKLVPSSAAAIKNNKIVLTSGIIEAKNISKIFNDIKRKKIYIDIIDLETKGNIDQIKLKYNYKFKDFFENINVRKEWR